MVLVLKNDQLEDLVPMADEIDAIEQAYREMGEGSAVNSPRARLRVQAPGKKEGFQYYFNNIMGLVPGMKSMGLRIDSTFSDEVEVAGAKRRIYPGDYVGLVFLFDMDDCTLLSIMDDHYISIFRVGATSGVAAKHLARKDAKVMGLVGSGEQAQTQLLAACAVRKLDKVKVFSPTKANRERFAELMTEKNPLTAQAHAKGGAATTVGSVEGSSKVGTEGREREMGGRTDSRWEQLRFRALERRVKRYKKALLRNLVALWLRGSS